MDEAKAIPSTTVSTSLGNKAKQAQLKAQTSVGKLAATPKAKVAAAPNQAAILELSPEALDILAKRKKLES